MPAEGDTHNDPVYHMQGVVPQSAVNIFLMQYFEIQIVTGNALCVSKDELNRQEYTYMYNSWVGVLHVFTCHLSRIGFTDLQFTNCAN